MNEVLKIWNEASTKDAVAEVLPICGSRAWAALIVARRPFAAEPELALAADEIWWSLTPKDWLEAFCCHPRIGEQKTEPASHQVHPSDRSTAWARQEQSSASSATITVLNSLAEKNHLYEQRFGFTYIVCATGKSAEQMLAVIERRLVNDLAVELHEAAEQQREITQLRLRKWLAP